MLCISHLSLAQYIRTNGVGAFTSLACYICTSIFVEKILKSMCDCCKSIFKLVMNDQSIVLIVLIHAQTCAYISSHTFYVFSLQLNKCQISKREKELQKSSHILVFVQEKWKATYIEMYGGQKAKGLLIKMKYQKFQASILKRDEKIKK